MCCVVFRNLLNYKNGKNSNKYIPFYTTGALNNFLKITYGVRRDSLFSKMLAAFRMSFKKINVHVLFLSLSWWLTSVQYTDSTETAVVAFLFSVSRTQFFGLFKFQTVCLKL